MVKPTFITGDVPSAQQVNDWFVNIQFVRKAVTESVTSSTTFQNDDELVLPVAAGATYELSMVIRYDAANAADLKFQIVLPASAFFRGFLTRLHPSAVTTADASLIYISESQSNALGGLGASADCAAFVRGTVLVGVTAGNIQLQWAQDVSNATASRVWAESYMTLTRIA